VSGDLRFFASERRLAMRVEGLQPGILEVAMSPGPSKSARPAPAGELAVRTERRAQLLDVTAAVAKMVQDSGVQSGVCYVYVPHTTAGVIINENADPDVAADMEAALARLVPKDSGYRHAEGNSDSHIKAALVGTSATIFISGGQLELGRWQGIFFCEFDGPRTRRLRVKIVPD
jgi:secondary thiamine-phosphate synthase enzyme